MLLPTLTVGMYKRAHVQLGSSVIRAQEPPKGAGD